MEVVVSLLTGIGISFATIKDIITTTKPYGDQLNDMCFHPANNDSQGNLRVVYSGLSSHMDRALCVLVNVFQNASHDIMGAPITALLLATFGTVIVLMSLEGARKGFKGSLLALFPLYAFSANIITATVMFAFIWAPLSLYYKRRAQKADFNITLPDVYGSLVGVLVAYGLPTVLLFSPLVQPDSRLEQDLWASWQFVSLLMVPLIPLFIKFFCQPSIIDRVDDKALRERLYVAEGKDALEKVYLTLGIVNMLIYFGMYLKVALQGIHIWDSLVLLYRAPDNLPATVTFGDLGQIVSTRIMLIDLVAFSLGLLVWTFLDGGVLAGLTVAFVMPIIGPSAVISFYSYYRESKIQNLAAMNPPTEKPSSSRQKRKL
ncbi:unnamed protein product [Rhizopus stolonifer]